MTVFAMPSNRLPVPSVLFSIRQKPFDRLLVIVVLLTLDNDLRGQGELATKKKRGKMMSAGNNLLASVDKLISALLGEIFFG